MINIDKFLSTNEKVIRKIEEEISFDVIKETL